MWSEGNKGGVELLILISMAKNVIFTWKTTRINGINVMKKNPIFILENTLSSYNWLILIHVHPKKVDAF